MEFQKITTISEMDSLVNEWNNLLTKSVKNYPFLRHEYLRGWWQTLGGGEWKTGELNLITARQDGQLVGIAPLFFTHNRESEPALMFLGSTEISDYLDFIVLPEVLPGFINGLAAFLSDPIMPAWKILDLHNLQEETPTLSELKCAASKMGWVYQQERMQPSPRIVLPGDWEAYLSTIDKKQRHEIRRKMRKVEESGASVCWYFVEDESSLDHEMDIFFELMAQDADKKAFLTDQMRQQMKLTAHSAFQNGWLQLAFLEVDQVKVAGYYNFDYANQIWVYNSGLNRKYSEYSPGWVLLGNLLKWANDQKRQVFDFMRGNEDYKYRFGAVDWYVVKVRIERT
jgi:CelD/BcsL family acetyltransferase involved in cellulose biosynthesis